MGMPAYWSLCPQRFALTAAPVCDLWDIMWDQHKWACGWTRFFRCLWYAYKSHPHCLISLSVSRHSSLMTGDTSETRLICSISLRPSDESWKSGGLCSFYLVIRLSSDVQHINSEWRPPCLSSCHPHVLLMSASLSFVWSPISPLLGSQTNQSMWFHTYTLLRFSNQFSHTHC